MKRSVEILMCPPTNFDVRYAINPWMKPDGVPVNRARALEQWGELVRAIGAHAHVSFVEAQTGLPDMCFTANAGFVHGAKFVVSRFQHTERRGEEAHFSDWFASRGYTCERLAGDVVFEGAGDALHDSSGRIWMGYGQRSSLDAVHALRDSLAAEIVALQLVDPRFYHLDTCFCPLRSGGVVYFPGAFSRQALGAIEDRFLPSQRIAVSEDDATVLACNIVDLGSIVLLHRASASLRREFARRGIAVHAVDLSEFLKSGGAAKCLVLPLPAAQHSMRHIHATVPVATGCRDPAAT